MAVGGQVNRVTSLHRSGRPAVDTAIAEAFTGPLGHPSRGAELGGRGAMRIDSHHHVWDLSVRDQGWIVGDALAPLRRSYSLDDLRPSLRSAHIDGTVLVQTVPVAAETPEFLDIAGASPEVVGVVGWLDLESDRCPELLAGYRVHPHARYLVGIRDLAQFKDDPRWLARPDVIARLRWLGDEGVPYDLLTLPPQLPAAVEAVRACPGTSFVMDHLSKPYIARGELEPWATQIRELGSLPNVVIKVSGMFTEAAWRTWEPDDFRPCFGVLLDAFGPDRMLFGSDWPVCTLSATYEQTIDVMEELMAGEGLSDAEREAIWSDTARRAYALQLAG